MTLRAQRFTRHASTRHARWRREWETYRTDGRWWKRRNQWLTSGHANTHCPGCGEPVGRNDDVHHLHYPQTPGEEKDEDLLLLCRTCHELIHASIDASPTWQATDRRTATWAVLATVAKSTGRTHAEMTNTSKNQARTITHQHPNAEGTRA